MPELASLVVEVTPRGIAEAKAQLDALAQSSGVAEQKTGGFKQAWAGMRDFMQGPVAAFHQVVAAAKAVYAVVEDLTGEYFAQTRAVSNLEAVLRSTGGTLGMTSGQLQGLADEMQTATGFADELVIQSEAVLATFKAVGQDIFPQAIEAAADLSTVLGMDLQSATIMLGKALNDPIQGVQALRRVGVQLTDAQEEQIKSFMAVNDVASAQAVIMKEVESQVGGAARAAMESAEGGFKQLGIAFGELKESIGEALADSLTPWVNKLTEAVEKTNQLAIAQNALNAYAKGTATTEQTLLVYQSEIARLKDEVANQIALEGSANEEVVRYLQSLIRIERNLRLGAGAGTFNGVTGTYGTVPAGTGHVSGMAAGATAFDPVAAARKEYFDQQLAAGLMTLPGATGLDYTVPSGTAGLDEFTTNIIRAQLAVESTTNAALEFGQVIGQAMGNASKTVEGLADGINQLGPGLADLKDDGTLGGTPLDLWGAGANAAPFGAADKTGADFADPFIDAEEKARAFQKALDDIGATLQSYGKQAFVSTFNSIGEALASGASFGETFAESMASLAQQIMNELPLMLLDAGLKAIIAGNVPVGTALIVASGLVAIGAGVMNYSQANPSSVTPATGEGSTGRPERVYEDFARGGAFMAPSLSAYSGGVFDSPHAFGWEGSQVFARGGVFGEAGPEAIMPLKRSPTGTLGVQGTPANVTVIVNNNAAGVEVKQSETIGPDGERQIILAIEKTVQDMVGKGRLDGLLARGGVRPQGVRN